MADIVNGKLICEFHGKKCMRQNSEIQIQDNLPKMCLMVLACQQIFQVDECDYQGKRKENWLQMKIWRILGHCKCMQLRIGQKPNPKCNCFRVISCTVSLEGGLFAGDAKLQLRFRF